VFKNIDIIRGQSRGLKSQSALMSLFGNEKKDETGNVTNEKSVGYFKGFVEVANDKTQDLLQEDKKRLIKEITRLINDIYKKRYKSSIDFKQEDLDIFEKQYLLKILLA
jgi:hypothetical protein